MRLQDIRETLCNLHKVTDVLNHFLDNFIMLYVIFDAQHLPLLFTFIAKYIFWTKKGEEIQSLRFEKSI